MPDYPDDVVERVARAICQSYGYDPDEDAPIDCICGPNNEVLPLWEAYSEQARAAIAAMRGWRPIESAPVGSFREVEGPKGIRKIFERDWVWSWRKDGHMTQSYWIPEQGRWCGYTKEAPPDMWFPFKPQPPEPTDE